MDWKDIKIEGIGYVEKCVGEFIVAETQKTPYGKFKVKIYEKQNEKYVGYTNLQVKDKDGCTYAGVGHGSTVEETLKDTVEYFMSMVNEITDSEEDIFECSDSFDF